jgi:hypothetical protein
MLMGSETEFGILGGWSLAAATEIQAEIEKRHRHMQGTKEGVFLANGSRVYVDQQAQNEYSTPEVDDPLLLVRHEMAGRTLMQAAAAARGRTLLCSNLDYESGHGWGTHENYECRTVPDAAFCAIMTTHLATRIVYTGAGGPMPGQPGVGQVISPRAAITEGSYAEQERLCKSMIFRKPHHHGAGYRLHIFCGESLLCTYASWLKYGATALIAQSLDAGLLDPQHLAARDPLRVMRSVNRDISLDGRQQMRDGTRLTALEIQRRLARAVGEHVSRLPAWAGDVLHAWHDILDGLTRHEPRVRGLIDWLLYLRLWGELAREHGMGSEDPCYPAVEAASGHVADVPDPDGRRRRLAAASQELYVRLHALDEEGPLKAARDAGWVAPPPHGLDARSVSQAHDEAPAGRPANRARVMSALDRSREYAIDWDRIVDADGRCSAAIPRDPDWSGELIWELDGVRDHLPPADGGEGEALLELVGTPHTPGFFEDCFRAGDYREALRLYTLPGSEVTDLTSVVLCQARLGRVTETQTMLDTVAGAETPPFVRVALELFCAVNYGLAPPLAECLRLIEEGELLLPGFDHKYPESDYHRAVFDQCRGRVRLYQGRPLEAISLLKAAAHQLRHAWRPRMLARTHCILADAYRRHGNVAAARATLGLPERIQFHCGFVGDAVDHLIPVRVKLGDAEYAARALPFAEALQRRRGDDLGLARVLCLAARVRHDPSAGDEVRASLRGVEALRACPLANRIVDHWETWVRGGLVGDGGEFWGL